MGRGSRSMLSHRGLFAPDDVKVPDSSDQSFPWALVCRQVVVTVALHNTEVVYAGQRREVKSRDEMKMPFAGTKRKLRWPKLLPRSGTGGGNTNRQSPLRPTQTTISVESCVFRCISMLHWATSHAQAATPALKVGFCATTSLPSQNRGNSLPAMKCLSTLSLVITHIRIQPPDDPSRDMARDRADCQASIIEGGEITDCS